MSSSTDSAEELTSKKRSKLRAFSSTEKSVIYIIYKSTTESRPEALISEIVKQTASTSGVGEASVYRIIREQKSTGGFSSPKKNKPRKTILHKIDDFDKTAIRRIVHQFFFRNEIPTIDKVLAAVNDDESLPNFKRNETWVNAGHTNSHVWVNETVKSSRQAFLSGLSAGLKNPSGKGKRLTLTHIGSETGFVEGGLWTFESKKSGDYHEEMNSDGFEKWFANILPLLEDNCVIVLDNAPYHSRKSEKVPTTAWIKQKIKDWLRSKTIDFDEDMLKVELLQLVAPRKAEYNKYVIDDLAKAQNKTVLRLPPYHCELNPIELIWADAKNFVAVNNKTFKFANVKILLNDALNNITQEKWKNCVKHVQNTVEKKFWELDHIIEVMVEPLITEIGSNGDSDSSSFS
ncbi:uncharacterized protein [Diabrotica undecimpunctata]|uniref:uncharacterized protein n=1 Tax=Diabrotica undecimpunctata TaxID=50387 RepID=UPI003B638D56